MRADEYAYNPTCRTCNAHARVCIDTYLQASTHTHTHTNVHTYICTGVSACMHTFVRTCRKLDIVQALMHVHMDAHTRTYMHMSMHGCLETCVQASVFTPNARSRSSMDPFVHASMHAPILTCIDTKNHAGSHIAFTLHTYIARGC